MQPAEKLTPTFAFKLAALSVLLIVGVVLKNSKVPQASAAQNITNQMVPVSDDRTHDTLQLQHPYYKVVKDQLANSASI
ncbi:hypothetical protein ACSX1A_00385 [Pontibacter sp. MBLB2868]|uniref:hypothetical protein n=1 Tax=Pontibacter sp. MBLB2868 TaxID=3451555 RepID=UPI003F74BE4A